MPDQEAGLRVRVPALVHQPRGEAGLRIQRELVLRQAAQGVQVITMK